MVYVFVFFFLSFFLSFFFVCFVCFAICPLICTGVHTRRPGRRTHAPPPAFFLFLTHAMAVLSVLFGVWGGGLVLASSWKLCVVPELCQSTKVLVIDSHLIDHLLAARV